jgi:hypothetical protein
VYEQDDPKGTPGRGRIYADDWEQDDPKGTPGRGRIYADDWDQYGHNTVAVDPVRSIRSTPG